jgi:hypothetical protein
MGFSFLSLQHIPHASLFQGAVEVLEKILLTFAPRTSLRNSWEKADVGGRNCPRRSEARRTMSMSFDINEAVFDEQGTYLGCVARSKLI